MEILFSDFRFQFPQVSGLAEIILRWHFRNIQVSSRESSKLSSAPSAKYARWKLETGNWTLSRT
eukprot:5683553-Prymnesium_polylepis.2